jgi:hypothetical protein
MSSLDTSQLFDCLFANTCEGHDGYDTSMMLVVLVVVMIIDHNHDDHEINFDAIVPAGLPASSTFDPADVTRYWDAQFDL